VVIYDFLFADPSLHQRSYQCYYTIINQYDKLKVFRLICHGTKLEDTRKYVFGNALGKVNFYCHDHWQNNNECASEKAKRGFANPFFNDRANPTGKGMPGVHYYPFKVSGSVIRTDEKGMAICFDEKYTISPYEM